MTREQAQTIDAADRFNEERRLGELTSDMATAADQRDHALDLYDRVIGRIRKLGGLRHDHAREHLGAAGVQNMRSKYGLGFVANDGEYLDKLADMLTTEVPELSIDGDVQNLLDLLMDTLQSKKAINADYRLTLDGLRQEMDAILTRLQEQQEYAQGKDVFAAAQPDKTNRANAPPVRTDQVAKGYEEAVDALVRVLAGQGSESAKVRRPDIGDVTIDWGQAGTESKGFRNGHGLSHIVARRKLEGSDPAQTLAGVLLAITDGQVVREYGGDQGRLDLEKDGYKAVLSRQRFGKMENWLLTGFQDTSDAGGESYNPASYAPAVSVSRRQAGADVVEKIRAALEDVNPDRRKPGQSGNTLKEAGGVYHEESRTDNDAIPRRGRAGDIAQADGRGVRALPGARLVELGAAEKRNLPAEIDDPPAAASALRFLSDNPQEHVSALVVGENGAPLAILSHTIGTMNSSQVDKSALMGALRSWPRERNPASKTRPWSVLSPPCAGRFGGYSRT